MAEMNSTESKGLASPFEVMEIELNHYAALLNGIEMICRSGDVEEDGRYVAATVCGQINHALCEMANKLGRIAKDTAGLAT